MYSAILDFVDALGEMPRESWLAIGRAIRADTHRLAALSGARAILEVTLADRRLGLSAWHVKDAVESAAYLARRLPPPLSASDRRLFDETNAAADDAALALLARSHLTDSDFAILYAPFARHIPAPAEIASPS